MSTQPVSETSTSETIAPSGDVSLFDPKQEASIRITSTSKLITYEPEYKATVLRVSPLGLGVGSGSNVARHSLVVAVGVIFDRPRGAWSIWFRELSPWNDRGVLSLDPSVYRTYCAAVEQAIVQVGKIIETWQLNEVVIRCTSRRLVTGLTGGHPNQPEVRMLN